MSRASEKGKANLIPANKRSKSEVRENSRKGGIKSGKVRREKKIIRECLEELCADTFDNIPMSDSVRSQLTNIYGKKLDLNTLKLLTVGQVIKASQGDTKAMEFIQNALGQKPAEKIELHQASSEVIDEIERMVKGE